MTSRRLPVGAEPQANGGVHFRVWAPRRKAVEVVLEGAGACALASESDGYFAGLVPGARTGSRYRYRLDGGESFPDPASRFQPEGPHGPSEVVDPAAHRWRDAGWRGMSLHGQVIYEMHIGTFTREGTWNAAAHELASLARLGVTVLEVMPVGDFPGRFGWGYDGVNLYAPTRLYGNPDDFRRFVDAAHAERLGVILDVVYNHLGPDGNYLKQYAPDYFTDRYVNEWGEPVNFDGPGSAPVREFIVGNAGHWIDEYHLDGLRIDATQQMFDSSPVSILCEITARVREAAAGRQTVVVAENEPQDVKLLLSAAQGGCGIDALWNDDFHHATHVALTGHNEAYYSDFAGTAQELVAAVKNGFLYQGQWYAWQKQARGTPTRGIDPAAFVHCIQNHDQVANSATGRRVHELAAPGAWRALTALLLLSPQTPMIFQGQEFAASSPFLFFADHQRELAQAVRKGRTDFLMQFPSAAAYRREASLADPGDIATFERCRLDLSERERNHEAYALHVDLLALRREDPVFRAQRAVDGAVLRDAAFAVRFSSEAGDRLLLVNLGNDLDLTRAAEPLLAPLQGKPWKLAWSSEDARYGGEGTPAMPGEGGLKLRGRCALVMASKP
ncbi:MAG TPA: malto-oligosyltrehalose trehalohydrolase [Usitatibacter sp.]|nr:malto-oligosyltrehalose trehalohydrolase [Usitatibacter sp.]